EVKRGFILGSVSENLNERERLFLRVRDSLRQYDLLLKIELVNLENIMESLEGYQNFIRFDERSLISRAQQRKTETALESLPRTDFLPVEPFVESISGLGLAWKHEPFQTDTHCMRSEERRVG